VRAREVLEAHPADLLDLAGLGVAHEVGVFTVTVKSTVVAARPGLAVGSLPEPE
jgi:hypothetical protein